MMAHVTPGEIVIPPEVQTPEVLAALNRAFAQMGGNPTSFQAGHPDQKINPETGAPEFGWFDALLPVGLGIAGSAFLGPGIGTALGSTLGSSLAGVAGGAVGSGLGITAGNLLTGKPFDESLIRGGLGAVGSGVGGAIGSSFGGSATEAAAAPAVNYAGGGELGLPAYSGVSDAAARAINYGPAGGDAIADVVTKPNFFSQLMTKQGIGSGIGGLIGNAVADDILAPKTDPAAIDRGPSLPKTASPLKTYIGGGAPTAAFPTADYLSKYGTKPQWDFFPT